ncbi:hypothetical protein Tco_1088941, partial [Tanacetum coccineum]
VAFYFGSEKSDSLGYGLDKSTAFWNFARDILRDIFGCNWLPGDHTSACHHSCRSMKHGCLYDRLASP